MDNKSTILRFLARVGQSYEERFLKPLWNKYPNPEGDDWDALLIFLRGYAFARQGAPNDFTHAACDVIEQLKRSNIELSSHRLVDRVWASFSSRLKGSKLNHANNPLCPKGTNYERKYKGVSRMVSTSHLSVIEFMQMLASEGEPTNIVTYIKQNIERDNVRQVHRALSAAGGINGIGTKIASLFLRDTATFYHVYPQTDRHLLQPVDVWIRNVCSLLMGAQISDDQISDDQIARWIVKEATSSGVKAEALNEGIWYFGSQVAKSIYHVRCALNDSKYAKVLLDEHIEELRSALQALCQIPMNQDN